MKNDMELKSEVFKQLEAPSQNLKALEQEAEDLRACRQGCEDRLANISRMREEYNSQRKTKYDGDCENLRQQYLQDLQAHSQKSTCDAIESDIEGFQNALDTMRRRFDVENDTIYKALRSHYNDALSHYTNIKILALNLIRDSGTDGITAHQITKHLFSSQAHKHMDRVCEIDQVRECLQPFYGTILEQPGEGELLRATWILTRSLSAELLLRHFYPGSILTV